MKTKIATVLSIVGVLGAGSAAALVNTQILDGSASESSASAAVLPPAATVDLTVPSTTIDEIGDDDESTTTVAAPAPTTATTAPPSPTTAPTDEFLTAFNVGDSGVVTVDVVNGKLILVNAEASPGWTVVSTEEDDAEVEVEFASSSVRVTFEASFDGNVITPEVSSAAIPGPAPAAPAPANTTPYQDDDDHDDDEYDDEDEDRDDD